LVRDIADIRRFAVVDAVAETLIQQFLPGPLTIVLPARAGVPAHCLAPDGTLGFRISSDVTAQQIIAEYMAKHDAPLSCTSANVSGFPTGATPSEILAQFKTEASAITVVHDAGPRLSVPTTLVRVFGGQVTILRQGTISKEQIDCALADGTS
jgi:L-threonylcarbamoyladenylate synthase